MAEILTIWRAFLDEFNAACETDDWSKLGPYLTEDVEYQVTGMPFACQLSGRDSVIAGFAKSVRGFDQRFDSRVHEPVGIKLVEPDTVTAIAWGRYEKAGSPDVRIAAHGYWHFRDEKICRMMDIWDTTLAENRNALAWLAENGEDLDASYT